MRGSMLVEYQKRFFRCFCLLFIHISIYLAASIGSGLIYEATCLLRVQSKAHKQGYGEAFTSGRRFGEAHRINPALCGAMICFDSE